LGLFSARMTQRDFPLGLDPRKEGRCLPIRRSPTAAGACGLAGSASLCQSLAVSLSHAPQAWRRSRRLLQPKKNPQRGMSVARVESVRIKGLRDRRSRWSRQSCPPA
jgi:hypothetical protein